MLFSQDLPSNNLGIVDSKSDVVDLDIANRSMSFKQSPGLLNSHRHGGESVSEQPGCLDLTST